MTLISAAWAGARPRRKVKRKARRRVDRMAKLPGTAKMP
jgi:hypothetical protein